MNTLPFVSVIIPCRNEESYIAGCLDSLLEQDYPKDRLEILVVDGMSDDNTKSILEEYHTRFSFIRVVDNPKRITPCAFNTGITNATGEIIVIMGAHADYDHSYISKCVQCLEEYGADNVGGTMLTLPRGKRLIEGAIVRALSHPFGVGNSVFRTGSKEPKWVDTVFGGCYRKEIFDKIGLFNENLESAQDRDLNLRLIRAGGKILFHPEIVSRYYTRSDLTSFIRNNIRKGFWAVYPLKFVNYMPMSWRHLIPLFFVTGLFGSLGLSFLAHEYFALFALIAGSYLFLNLFFSMKLSVSGKDLRQFGLLPPVFATLHISYGFGSLYGLARLLFSKSFWSLRIKETFMHGKLS